MKVAIVGSREFPNLAKVVSYLKRNVAPADTVVSGGAQGVDSTAEGAALALGYEVISIKPDWEKHGKSAGFKRNKDIIDQADRVVAFWDGKSRGTKHDIDLALAARKPLEVIFP